ncbi:MAG: ABC transporter ATP-binding protein [Planctomycetia bacterium]
MSARTVRLEAVAKRFGRGPAVLDGVDLAVEAGQSLALLGPSGSGKTTVLRLVAGLERPDAGRVLLGEACVAGPGSWVAPERRGVGLLFQDLELWPNRSTAENIAFGLPGRPRGRAALAHPSVRSIAARLGVEHLLERSPERLSGGERQRAALARTLAPGPDVLLLDEPLAALDPARRADLRALLDEATRGTGTTLLVVTHSPQEALALGERIAVLERGRIVEQARGVDLWRAPRTVAGARALGEANLLPAQRDGERWRTALGELPALRHDDAGARQVLVRPEHLRAVADAGGRARVQACWCRGADHALRVHLHAGQGEQALLASSPVALPHGTAVRLSVEGPVAGVDGDLVGGEDGGA